MNLLLVGVETAAEPVSIPRFVASSKSWPQMADAGTSLQIEGRIGLISSKRLRFRSCNLDFIPFGNLRFPRILPNRINLLVSGRVARLDGKIVFAVARFERRPSDLESAREARNELPDREAKPWYNLAARIAERARFYEDDELARFSHELSERGILIERITGNGDARFLRSLAEKVARLGLSSALRMKLLHDALWLDRLSAAKPTSLMARIDRELNGSRVPLSDADAAFMKNYLKNPRTAYDRADESARARMHRAFLVDVALEHAVGQRKSGNSDILQLSRKLHEDFPELSHIAETWRNEFIAQKRQQASSLSRDELLELVRELEAIDPGGDAKQVTLQWITAREQEYRSGGVAGLVRLADEYVELLEDRGTARRLLREAYERSARDPAIAERLRAIGAVVEESEESRPASRPPARPLQNDLVPGMSSADVIRILGEPDDVTRLASARRLIEIWVFGSPTTTRICITLETRTETKDRDSRVLRVQRIQPN